MNLADLFDAHSIVTTLGLVGVLAIIFAETGLLVGLFFPGDSLLFIAGLAASGSAVKIVGAHLNVAALLIGAPIAAIIGSQVGFLVWCESWA
jgi:membrane-associated protein